MIFNTWSFAVFAVVVWTVYWAAIPKRAKPAYLVVVGAVFYAFSLPVYLALIAALSLVTFACGRIILATSSERTKTSALRFGVVAIAGVLAYFKYAGFLTAIVDNVAARDLLPAPHVVVPLAISFFTFEFVHVLIDVKRGAIVALEPVDFLAFAFFFPTLVAGPIKRYQPFVAQLAELDAPTRERSLYALYRVALGFFKKLVLADSASVLTAPLSHPGAPFHRLDYWVACLAYAAKIYFDFSGYSDIAIGVAGSLGIAIPENFYRPYGARNIRTFWRRWHMTLSSWVRDYVFLPLGGSRRPPAMVAANLLLAMALVGLWHGAAWTFVIWGLWHGAGLVLQRTWSRVVVARTPYLRAGGPLVTATSTALTFAFVVGGWVIFAAPTISDALLVYEHLLGA